MTKRNVMVKAHQIRKSENATMSAALRKAWALEKLAAKIHALREEIHPGGFIRKAPGWGRLDPMEAKKVELKELIELYTTLHSAIAEVAA